MRTKAVRHTNFDQQETWIRSGEHSSILCRSLESAATIEIQEHKQPLLLVGPTFVGLLGAAQVSIPAPWDKRGMHMVGLVRRGRNHPRIKENLSGGVGLVTG
jgi:hypothetical protein